MGGLSLRPPHESTVRKNPLSYRVKLKSIRKMQMFKCSEIWEVKEKTNILKSKCLKYSEISKWKKLRGLTYWKWKWKVRVKSKSKKWKWKTKYWINEVNKSWSKQTYQYPFQFVDLWLAKFRSWRYIKKANMFDIVKVKAKSEMTS